MRSDDPSLSTRAAALIGGAMLGVGAVAILVAERRRRLRPPSVPQVPRLATNIAMGALCMVAITLIERPVTTRLARLAAERRFGLTQWTPGPPWLRDAAAILLSDYAMYGWHVATHKVPFLWRWHLVHHVDLDLDASTALRFHALDMVISAPVRAAQVALIGVSPRALAIWQNWFFLSVLFHHSDVALPRRWERRLARVLTTPRMHGIHHTAERGRTASNWSSGFSLWDHLHRTFRFDAEDGGTVIGVPAYRDPAELGLGRMLAAPFGRERDAWAGGSAEDGSRRSADPVRFERSREAGRGSCGVSTALDTNGDGEELARTDS